MARLMSVVDAVRAGRIILFDTSVLIPLADEPFDHPNLKDALIAVDRDLRYAIDLNWWEFLRGIKGDQTLQRDIRQRRRKWLRDQGIKMNERRPAGYYKAFQRLLGSSNARGDAVDASLAAFALTQPGKYAIATGDSDDFCYHNGIILIKEFVSADCAA